ncbi:Rossmann-like and DUF2520 domain-containing protein [Sphingobacterium paludis]|uniref:Putative short-subunit dehydrogenase-like oxidoreductase (DUF2520 family) n=1 Tax=Sphingobacterium paludis TaxID=1476465 RepID=A0A4R7CTQ6_9SPHI|nr:Rossmann-like and DUF2520 domain-containing protein [Sphingobacterium paludis]TDS11108.1 putative short-subunit dehydrogenase-like oxidoreductase (DUF2520 family) [Sphingobacterium paludis]
MKITILGSGNVATHLGKALLEAGHRIVEIYSRNLANAQALASQVGATATDLVTRLRDDADIYLLAVSDQAIETLASQLPVSIRGMVVHCSGATTMDVLASFQRYGVIYPPQSLRKEHDTQMASIAFGIEGNTTETEDALLELVQEFAPKSFRCNSQQRLALHIGAVFANNFTNSLFQISFELLQAHRLPFHLLHPIMQETVEKAIQHEPRSVQTGPAQRDDQTTIDKHLNFISEKPNWVKIYQRLTEEIAIKKKN